MVGMDWCTVALVSDHLPVPSMQGPDAEAARGAGAEIVGGAELVDKVECLVSVLECLVSVVVCVLGGARVSLVDRG